MRARERPGDSKAGQGEGLGHALTHRDRCSGVRMLQLARQLLEAPKRPVVVGVAPCLAQSPAHAGPIPLGQVIEHISLLVPDATLHRRALAEHVAYGLSQRL